MQVGSRDSFLFPFGFAGGEAYSREGSSEADLRDIFERAIAKQEEGIVVKDLDSPYRLGDRSGSWLKARPQGL